MRTRIELEIIVRHDVPIPEHGAELLEPFGAELLEAVCRAVDNTSAWGAGGGLTVIEVVERATIKKVDLDAC